MRRGPVYTVAAGAGAAATGTQEKADGTLKPPAGRNGTVAAAADLYHHPPATATADHERY